MKNYIWLRFGTRDIPGGPDAILGPTGCKKDVARVDGGDVVNLDLEVHDERVPKVLALLKQAGKDPMRMYWEEYSEDELQAAPLLWVCLWHQYGTWTEPDYGVTYDVSQACPTCLTGIRQSSPLIVNGGEMLTVNRYRVSCSGEDLLLVRDTDVETLLAANVTGVNFWPVTAKYKSGAIGEIRWQQALIENVLPPMAPSTGLVEKSVCPTCQRGRELKYGSAHTTHVTYRREDLKNICDFNVSWENFGPFGKYAKDPPGESDPSFPITSPWIFVTPKVMNLIRAKTKKEKNYQGCVFTPIWIDDGDGVPKLAS